MLALSIAVPALERADLAPQPVAESAHDPGACAPSHDHSVCTQVGANFALASGPVHQRASVDLSASLALDGVGKRHLSGWAEGHPVRGPPHA